MYAVVMAGGSGTRFWPVSRKKRPKQFLRICGDDPMVVETCNRLNPLVSDEETLIILGSEHEKEARALFRGRGIQIIAEPVGRNTAPCIGLGAVFARHLGCKDPVAFLPADHFIANPTAFLESLRLASHMAESGAIVTLGIVPTRPETGYGYIHRDRPQKNDQGKDVYSVTAFVEKPDSKTARNYLTSGEYYWNAGIFVATPDTIMAETQKYLPSLFEGLNRLEGSMGDAPGSIDFESALKELYSNIESISFDYGIMERTRNPVLVVPCDCGWSDVGSWESLYELRKDNHDRNGNLLEGECMVEDCKNVFISNQGERVIACIGLEDCLIVDTADALFVGNLKKSQTIRKIVDRLKEEEREEQL